MIRTKDSKPKPTGPLRRSLIAAPATLVLAGAVCLSLPAPAFAAGRCTDTANALFHACRAEVQDDMWVAAARCLNVGDEDERAECYRESGQERREAGRECRRQFNWRREACGVLGEGRYDPDFDPDLFDDDFGNPTHPNPYFPLAIGNRWEYASLHETDTVEVLDRTKLIDGVHCLLVRDQVFRDGELVEDTDDWYALALSGDVWYCGEEVKDFETFAGDQPAAPELVSIDGSFKAGRDGDKPGVIFLASPAAGDAYLEEFSLGNAEDVTEILSASYAYGDDPDLDEMVPQDLADALCAGDCVVTLNYSLLEPGVIARKYAAPGVGVFLEIEPDDEQVIRLTGCNFDPRCATLPQP